MPLPLINSCAHCDATEYVLPHSLSSFIQFWPDLVCCFARVRNCFSVLYRVHNSNVDNVTTGYQRNIYSGKIAIESFGAWNFTVSWYPYDAGSVSFSEFSVRVHHLWTECPDGRLTFREYRNVRRWDTHAHFGLHRTIDVHTERSCSDLVASIPKYFENMPPINNKKKDLT